MRNKKGQHHAFTSVILSAKYTSCFLASGRFTPRPPPGLQPGTLPGDFRPPDLLNFVPQPLTPGATTDSPPFQNFWIRHRLISFIVCCCTVL